MSLVGPRPALPSEVVEFDEAHLVRQTVRPGVTGLWQVEGRDKPSFASYRYLDVFYVENQSLAIDLTVLVATARAVVRSCGRAVRGEPGERSEALRTAGSGAPEVVID
jgi:lipopolysaccharide/colanic/teichoic acid biosynthesis glycosyltransferase